MDITVKVNITWLVVVEIMRFISSSVHQTTASMFIKEFVCLLKIA